jgi:hypothetical protein
MPAMEAVDPVVRAAFAIGRHDRIATAGSCFGQHIGRHLRRLGFNFLDAEKPHPLLSGEHAERFGYGVFSARYGNIYTARQLLQLFQRAFGTFEPAEDMWQDGGTFTDPFRPHVQPGGFISAVEYRADRRKHFAAVRRMFTELDVFVFTLGLTEAWISRTDGAVFTLCPGVAGGRFDPDLHEFHNFDVMEVVGDMTAFITVLRRVNPACRIVLTVSPVPLVATAEDRHVLVSTVYSKSVLRVAAEQVVQAFDGVAYFPSYEIIAGNYSRGRYYGSDLRDVTDAGVAHVMRLFSAHYLVTEAHAQVVPASPNASEQHFLAMERVMQVMCDEEALDR